VFARGGLVRVWRLGVLALALAWGLPAEGGATRFAEDRPVDLTHIRLDLNVQLFDDAVEGVATIDVTALRDVDAIRFDAVDFEVTSVRLARGGAAPSDARYVNDDKSITVLTGDGPLKAGDAARVIIAYAVREPSDGLRFFHPSEAEPDIEHTMWSQGESITNRHWIPCFDHPGEFQTTEIVAAVPDGYEAVSNGALLSRVDNPDETTTFHWKQSQPHAIYLVTLVVSRFHVEQESWRGRPVVYYVPPRHKEHVVHSFGNTVRMLDFFSERFGVEYPWEKYAQVCAEHFGGGMENTSATTLGTGTLHDARAHIDTSSDGLVAHELGHQWFGDLVTCRNWSHIWLNEGFASYCEALWDEHDLGWDEYQLTMYRDERRALGAGKTRPVLDREYDSPDSMFDGRAYPKGAWILHMMRHRLGDGPFFRGIQQYLTEFRHQPVETHDFRRVMERATGHSLERFFYDWVEREGHPELTIRYGWNQADGTADVEVEQTQKADPFNFPLEMAFHLPGQDPVLVTREVSDRKQTFSLPLPGPPQMVRFDPNNVVLKEVTEEKPRDLWIAQLTDDPNPVGRMRTIKVMVDAKDDLYDAALVAAFPKESFYAVAGDLARALGDIRSEQARDALLAGAQHADARVRRAAVEALREFTKDDAVVAALERIVRAGDASYRVESAAIDSWAKAAGKEAKLETLQPLLARDSHQEMIRRAVIEALGELKDPAALDVILDWTRRGRANEIRRTAFSAAVALKRNAELSGEPVQRIVQVLSGCLDEAESRRTLYSAISALSDLGPDAVDAVPALKKLIDEDEPDERLQRSVDRAIEAIKRKPEDSPDATDSEPRRGRPTPGSGDETPPSSGP